MKRALVVSIISCAIAVAACVPGSGQGPNGAAGQLAEMAMSPAVTDFLASRAANAVVARGQPLPSPRASFTYAGDDASDILLHSSLSLDDVKANFTPSADIPERANLWLQKVRQSGGEVLTCDVSTGSGFGGIFAAWLLDTLGGLAVEAVRGYALYRPAGNRHAIIEKDAGTGLYRAIRFVPRDGDRFTQARAGYRQCRS